MPVALECLTALTLLDLREQESPLQLDDEMEFLEAMTALRHLKLRQQSDWTYMSLVYLSSAAELFKLSQRDVEIHAFISN